MVKVEKVVEFSKLIEEEEVVDGATPWKGKPSSFFIMKEPVKHPDL